MRYAVILADGSAYARHLVRHEAENIVVRLRRDGIAASVVSEDELVKSAA